MKTSSFTVVSAVLLTTTCLLPARPMDRTTVEILKMAKAAAGDGEQLSAAQLADVLAASQADNAQMRMAAAYAMSYSDSDAAHVRLLAMVESEPPVVAGVAEFALLRAQLVRLDEREQLALASFEMARREKAWTRVLLVSYLGDTFKAVVSPLFLAALRTEQDAPVRAELYFQLAQHATGAHLAQTASLLKKEATDPARSFGEAEFLNAVSESAIKRSTLPGAITRIVESRLAQEEGATGR